MTSGLTRLSLRSSPARQGMLRTASQFTPIHSSSKSSHSTSTSTPAEKVDTMLARANKQFQATAPSQRPALSKELFPSSSPSAPTDIRDQFKKPSSAATATNAATAARIENINTQSPRGGSTEKHRGGVNRAITSLYQNSDSFKENSGMIIDLTGPESSNKLMDFELHEDDFCDDEELDLDFEAPSFLPPILKKSQQPPSKDNMPPPPTPTQNISEWSSSPPSHWQRKQDQPNLQSTNSSSKRQSPAEDESIEQPVAKKRSRLPWKNGTPEESQDAAAKTPARTSRKDFFDPSASAVKEQKQKLKSQRQPQKAEDMDDAMAEIHRHQEATIPKVNPISLSQEQRHVLDLVVNKNQSVFFTGPAGTGKSVLMRAIIEDMKKKYAKDPERVAVTASTGLAACNIGGITLHSFSGIGLGKEDASTLVKKVKRNPKAKNRWLKTKCLIIDEISMVDGDLFDKLSQIGRLIRNNGRPWGGIQLIITGDFFQLPPVPDRDSRDVKFAFDASTWDTSIDHTIGLTEVFRQRDPVFARMLNEMRLGQITPETERAFKALSRPLKFDDGVDMAHLYPTRQQVENSNAARLRALPGEGRRYEALDTGDPQIRDKLLNNMMAPKALDLKVGAQVMLIKNWDESLVNGSLGKVIAFSDERGFEMSAPGEYDAEMDDAMAKARRKLATFGADGDKSDGQKYPVVQFIAVNGTHRVVLCQPEEWKVELPNGEVQAKRNQLPLILAWSLSIHKAQGQTLERVTVDLGKVFEKGQAYVALSRATSQQGLQVLNFSKNKVMAHPKVSSFYQKLYSVEKAMKVKPRSINDFVENRRGAQGNSRSIVKLDGDEEALASLGY